MKFLTKIPTFSANVLTIILYLILAYWVLRRSKSYVMEGAPTSRGWRDLRLWALALIGIQIILYFIF
jgi:hypothetical protein